MCAWGYFSSRRERDVLQTHAGEPAGLVLGTRSSLSSVPPSSGACAPRAALAASAYPPAPGPAALVEHEGGTLVLQGLVVGSPPYLGMGKGLAGWRGAGSSAMTTLSQHLARVPDSR